jgi:N-acetylglutamate synthase-like GNAT family acetyltransferase
LSAVKITHQLDAKHIEQLHLLYQSESWAKGRTLTETKSCVSNSSICIAMIEKEGNLVGFTRVLTDYVFKALIFDVIVHEKYRGDGLGNTLIAAIKNHPKLTSVKHFELYCLEELDHFYQKHGFTTNVSNMRLMRYISPAASQT